MTNREKYKQAFSALHTSDGFSLEGMEMKKAKKIRTGRILAVCAATVLLVALLTAFGIVMPQDKGGATNGQYDGPGTIEITRYEGSSFRLGNGNVLLFDTKDYLEDGLVKLHISMWPVEGMEDGQAVLYGYYQEGELIPLNDEKAENIHDGSEIVFPVEAIEYDQVFIQSVSTDTIYIIDID